MPLQQWSSFSLKAKRHDNESFSSLDPLPGRVIVVTLTVFSTSLIGRYEQKFQGRVKKIQKIALFE